jgi:steroid 5-alpha reductase family enzyme
VSGIDGGALAANLAATVGLTACVMAVTFLLAQRLGRHSVIDTVWGLGFALTALCTFGLSTFSRPAVPGNQSVRIVITTLTVVWGVRLAVHIGLRSRGHGEDPRYEKLLASSKGDPALRALKLVYLPQGVILWFVSLPVQIAQYVPAASSARTITLLVLGGAVWTVGFFFEAVGDYQLGRFRAQPLQSGAVRGVLDTGLWRYTRHPNYFGDACVWWGLYLVACVHWLGVLMILSPSLMTYFLAGKTGKPLMEEYLGARPGYAEYVRRTSSFLPRRPARDRQSQSSSSH